MKYFKEQQLWRKVEKMSKNPKYKMELDILRNHRNSGKDSKVVELPTGTGEIYTELSKILSQGKERAEQKALANGDIPIDTILGARLAKKYLRFGNTQKAINVQQETLQQQ
jgi:hypothetical protein